eukprot:3502129-Rhodomonas_salina.1
MSVLAGLSVRGSEPACSELRLVSPSRPPTASHRLGLGRSHIAGPLAESCQPEPECPAAGRHHRTQAGPVTTSSSSDRHGDAAADPAWLRLGVAGGLGAAPLATPRPRPPRPRVSPSLARSRRGGCSLRVSLSI